MLDPEDLPTHVAREKPRSFPPPGIASGSQASLQGRQFYGLKRQGQVLALPLLPGWATPGPSQLLAPTYPLDGLGRAILSSPGLGDTSGPCVLCPSLLCRSSCLRLPPLETQQFLLGSSVQAWPCVPRPHCICGSLSARILSSVWCLLHRHWSGAMAKALPRTPVPHIRCEHQSAAVSRAPANSSATSPLAWLPHSRALFLCLRAPSLGAVGLPGLTSSVPHATARAPGYSRAPGTPNKCSLTGFKGDREHVQSRASEGQVWLPRPFLALFPAPRSQQDPGQTQCFWLVSASPADSKHSAALAWAGPRRPPAPTTRTAGAPSWAQPGTFVEPRPLGQPRPEARERPGSPHLRALWNGRLMGQHLVLGLPGPCLPLSSSRASPGTLVRTPAVTAAGPGPEAAAAVPSAKTRVPDPESPLGPRPEAAATVPSADIRVLALESLRRGHGPWAHCCCSHDSVSSSVKEGAGADPKRPHNPQVAPVGRPQQRAATKPSRPAHPSLSRPLPGQPGDVSTLDAWPRPPLPQGWLVSGLPPGPCLNQPKSEPGMALLSSGTVSPPGPTGPHPSGLGAADLTAPNCNRLQLLEPLCPAGLAQLVAGQGAFKA
nr:collagen alpha-1(I) chain-like [Macaca fascicularis]